MGSYVYAVPMSIEDFLIFFIFSFLFLLLVFPVLEGLCPLDPHFLLWAKGSENQTSLSA